MPPTDDTDDRASATRTIRSPFAVAPSRRNKQERVGHDLEKQNAVVVAAQDAALAAIRGGVATKDVDAAARQLDPARRRLYA
jgi:Xaa-Pro aminopeptidase